MFFELDIVEAKTSKNSYRPTISGYALLQFQADGLISSKRNNDFKRDNSFFYFEPNFTMQFDENWSVKTQWRLQPNNVLTTRDPKFPERYRTIQSNDRSLLNIKETALLVEEIKIHFENEDMRLHLGKFDPQFGTAHRKSKRIGVFAAQFAEDYNLREKIGGGVVALIEGAQIHLDTFFSDSTGLSGSLLNNRGQLTPSNGLAGNTGTLSSYAISVEGENFFSVRNWFYNLGYRSQGIRGGENRAREVGYVFGSEYLYKIGDETSLIPYGEYVQFSNFNGARGNNAKYATAALIMKYRSWSISASAQKRRVMNQTNGQFFNDSLEQFSAGYKFNDNLAIDVSRAKSKESNKVSGIFGVNLSYIYKF